MLIALIGAPFGESFVTRGVSVADLALAAGAGLALLLAWRHPGEGRLPRDLLRVALLLVAWSLIDALAVASAGPLAFDWGEHVRSLAKLVFYLGATLVLARAWEAPPAAARWLCDALLTVLAIHAVIGLYGAVAASTELGWPYRFLAVLSPNADATTTIAAVPGIHRVRGLAGEPTYFGWFQATGLGIALLGPLERRPAVGAGIALVVLSVVGSFSLVGVGLLAVALLLGVLSRRRRLAGMLAPLVTAGVLCLAFVLVTPRVGTALRLRLVDRVLSLASGEADPSSSVHLIGSWELAAQVLAVSPWLGSGLGNYDVALDAIGAQMSGDLRTTREIGYNAYAAVVGSLGPLGLLLFLGLLGVLARRDLWLAVLFAAAAWGNSTFLGAPFWVLFVLAGAAAVAVRGASATVTPAPGSSAPPPAAPAPASAATPPV